MKREHVLLLYVLWEQLLEGAYFSDICGVKAMISIENIY